MASDHYRQLIGRRFIALSVVLTLVFWAVLTRVLLPHVPVADLTLAYVGAGFTAACLSGVFFLALHMFALVLGAHRRRKA
jgi:hypothetical protein